MERPGRQQKTALRRCLNWIRFDVGRLLLRGLHYRLLLAASIVVLVSLIAGSLAALLDPGFKAMDEAVWWAFLRLTDPGYLGDDEGMARRSISAVVTVLGYILFLGLLIAILTQWLNETLRKLESGVTPVALANHVVILGWSYRTPTIVASLLRTRARVQRFLARLGTNDLRIVILAERVDAALVTDLRTRLGELWNDRQVFVRAGTPLWMEHLERVAVRDAAVVVLPGADFIERNLEAVDAETVKTLMAVSQHLNESGVRPPLAVAELYDGSRAAVARRVYAGESEVLAADEIVSCIIAQSVRQQGLCSVFAELLTLGVGNAIYVRRHESRAGARFRDLQGTYSSAILLGTVRPGGERPNLNPDSDTVLGEDDLLVLLARDYDDCTPDLPPLKQPRDAVERTALPTVEPGRRVLILGWSRKVPALLQEFARYGKDAFSVDVVSATPLSERMRVLQRTGTEVFPEQVRHLEASYTVPEVIERIEPTRHDNVVLLASERLVDERSADAATVLAYQIVVGQFEKDGPRPGVFVELLDDENQFLFRGGYPDVIVSPTFVSYLLSQVALRRELAAVFSELSQPWGAQIGFRPAIEYADVNSSVRFADVERAAALRGEIAIGFRLGHQRGGALELNPNRQTNWHLTADGQVVVLSSYAEPSPD